MAPDLTAGQAKAAAAERGIAVVRLAIVAFNSILYLGWILPAGIPWLAGTVIVVANVYSLWVVLAPIEFRQPMLAAVWTGVTDAILIIVWLTATGGPASPFWILWSISIVAIAFRFGPVVTRWVTAAYVAFDIGLLSLWGGLLPVDPLTAVRIAYIPFFGLLSINMSSSNLDALKREQELAATSARLADSETRLQAILENAPSFIVLVEPDGTIRYTNQAPSGTRVEDVVGASFLDFVHQDDRQQLEDTFAAVLASQGPQAIEVRGSGPDGTMAIYQCQLAPLGTAQQGRVLIMAADVTVQRAQEAEAARAQVQDQQIQQLQERDTYRRDLLNAVAHELNTPLTPLRLQLELMGRADPGDDRIELLQRNIDRLANLVEDLLQVARFDAKAIGVARTEIDVARVIRESVTTFEAMAAARNVTVTQQLAPDLRAQVDEPRFGQILNNLLSNAIKYSPEGATVRVEAATTDDEFVLSVADDGPGFTPEQIGELFQPFHVVHPSPRGAASTGLGLFITRRLVEAHGGTVKVHSPGPGKGSRFEVTVPRRA